jgi:hypothetical protein
LTSHTVLFRDLNRLIGAASIRASNKQFDNRVAPLPDLRGCRSPKPPGITLRNSRIKSKMALQDKTQ